jgi:DNA-directed RNA polymerase specialized sigma24 family protein
MDLAETTFSVPCLPAAERIPAVSIPLACQSSSTASSASVNGQPNGHESHLGGVNGSGHSAPNGSAVANGHGGIASASAVAAVPLNRTLVLDRCLKRIRSWRVPPNWSPLDWLEEARAISAAAACQAEIDFDSSRGVPIGAFIYQRALAGAFTRYRQEWAYARHCLPDRAAASALGQSEEEADPLPPRTECWVAFSVASLDPVLAGDALDGALGCLSAIERELLLLLFWSDQTESQIACSLGISQPAVNKRKHAIFRQLRLWFDSHDNAGERRRAA